MMEIIAADVDDGDGEPGVRNPSKDDNDNGGADVYWPIWPLPLHSSTP